MNHYFHHYHQRQQYQQPRHKIKCADALKGKNCNNILRYGLKFCNLAPVTYDTVNTNTLTVALLCENDQFGMEKADKKALAQPLMVAYTRIIFFNFIHLLIDKLLSVLRPFQKFPYDHHFIQGAYTVHSILMFMSSQRVAVYIHFNAAPIFFPQASLMHPKKNSTHTKPIQYGGV
ncbi:hypothetical protein GQX74_003787 [Glossina fuscipes]|nr:hypothetical protein GQX74_003787 [Glossina fuscipes]